MERHGHSSLGFSSTASRFGSRHVSTALVEWLPWRKVDILPSHHCLRSLFFLVCLASSPVVGHSLGASNGRLQTRRSAGEDTYASPEASPSPKPPIVRLFVPEELPSKSSASGAVDKPKSWPSRYRFTVLPASTKRPTKPTTTEVQESPVSTANVTNGRAHRRHHARLNRETCKLRDLVVKIADICGRKEPTPFIISFCRGRCNSETELKALPASEWPEGTAIQTSLLFGYACKCCKPTGLEEVEYPIPCDDGTEHKVKLISATSCACSSCN